MTSPKAVHEDVTAVQMMETSSREVTASATQSQEAGDALSKIREAATSVTTGVASVLATAQAMESSMQAATQSVQEVMGISTENARAAHAMAQNADHVGMAITSVASISEETAAGAEQMSASAFEVSPARTVPTWMLTVSAGFDA